MKLLDLDCRLMLGVSMCLSVCVCCSCCLCMCIPCCIDALRDVRHRCPGCQSVIGRYERLKF